MGQDVVLADVLNEVGALEHFGGLVAGSAEDQRAAGFLQALR